MLDWAPILLTGVVLGFSVYRAPSLYKVMIQNPFAMLYNVCMQCLLTSPHEL